MRTVPSASSTHPYEGKIALLLAVGREGVASLVTTSFPLMMVASSLSVVVEPVKVQTMKVTGYGFQYPSKKACCIPVPASCTLCSTKESVGKHKVPPDVSCLVRFLCGARSFPPPHSLLYLSTKSNFVVVLERTHTLGLGWTEDRISGMEWTGK